MGVFEQFPYSNYHDLNLDWILGEIKRVSETVAGYDDRLDGIDDRLDGLDADVARVEGEIPDIVQTVGLRTDAVMSQKAVTDAISQYGGVRSIEHYHQDTGRLTPTRSFDDRYYHLNPEDPNFTDFITEEGSSCARYTINENDGPFVIITSGYGDPSDMRQLAAAAAFDDDLPTPSSIPLYIWAVPASEGEYQITVDLPSGTRTVLVNAFDSDDPGLAKVLTGIWKWDGQPDDSVGSDALMTGAVTTAKIADGAVTEDKLAEGAVTADKIGSGAVTAAKIATGAVTAAKIPENSIPGSKLINLTIPAAKIALEAVTTSKIADNAVTSDKLADGSVIAGKLSVAAVQTENLETGAVTAEELATGAVEADKIAEGAVGTGKIANSAVTSAKLATGAVTVSKIADNSITTSKLSTGAVAGGVAIRTITPIEDNPGPYFLTILAADPAVKYDGWIYLIKE